MELGLGEAMEEEKQIVTGDLTRHAKTAHEGGRTPSILSGLPVATLAGSPPVAFGGPQ